ncbi:PREDICTED: mucin-2 [Drosophila arizonae]|uniref:Mucin-2 n=1 Tax=Drosophila arizonae TaxID=7263 RepID=A0ABM1PW97_DROAR|nr:PREDICTED: mucin-2 [Drosophila arizonae]
MTRKRSSPLGLEELMSLAVLLLVLPALTLAAPVQEYTEITPYPEGCYYNYGHYNEGDRIMTNEPCLNCTCHNRMLMCYLRVCPFTKPIGQDCIVEKREDQCCPIVTCPVVHVEVPYRTPEPGTELSIPEKFGCSIEEKFYPEGAQVPSNPNKPCELCYCINNQTKCVMQECTLHVDGCTPIYNKGSCCPVRYSCDHENDVLELEDHSTTTTTVRPTPGFILTTTMTPAVSTDCIHNGETFADGASIEGKNACEHCYCMRGDIVCAVQECEMPMSTASGKTCRAMPAAEGECCPSNYICDDDSTTTESIESTTLETSRDEEPTATASPVKDIPGEIPKEDLDLQEHIDDKKKDEDAITEGPLEEAGSGEVDQEETTVAPTHDDKIKEKEPETSTVVTDARIDTPAESSTTSIEEGSGEQDVSKATTPPAVGADKPAEPTKEGSGEETTPTLSEEGSGEVDTTSAPSSQETSPESEEDIVKTSTPVAPTGIAEDGQDATTPTVDVSDKEEVPKETIPSVGLTGEEDVPKGTTPASAVTDEEDASKATTPSEDVTETDDVARITTPTSDISDKEDAIKGTTPAPDVSDEEEIAKPTTPTELTDQEDGVKATTPAVASDKVDQIESSTPTSIVSDSEEVAKGTTPAADSGDKTEEIVPATESDKEEDVKATSPAADEDFKVTTPTADTDKEDDLKVTTSATDVSDKEEVTTSESDEEDVVKSTTQAPDVSEKGTSTASQPDEEDVVKATTPASDFSDKGTSTPSQADEEDIVNATTPASDVSDKEEAGKATTPAIEVDEEEVAKGTTPAAEYEIKVTTPSADSKKDEDEVKTTTPVADVSEKVDVSTGTTAEEDTVKATTPAKEVSGEEDIIKETTAAPGEEISEQDTRKPDTSATSTDEIAEEDIVKATTPAAEGIDTTKESTDDIVRATTPAGATDEKAEKATTPAKVDIDITKDTTPAEDVSAFTETTAAAEIIKSTTPAGEDIKKDTDKATTVAEQAGEDISIQTTPSAEEASSEKDKDVVKPTGDASFEEVIPSTTSDEDTTSEKEEVKGTTPAAQPIKPSTPKTEEDQTTESDEYSTEEDSVQTTTTPAHISSSTTEGVSEQDTSDVSSEEDTPAVQSTTASPKQPEDQESDEKESVEDHTEEATTIEAEKEIVSSTSATLGKEPTEEQTTQAVPVKSDIAPSITEADQSTAQPEESEEATTDKPSTLYLPPVSEDEPKGTEIPETSEEDLTASTEEESSEPAKVTPEKQGPIDTRHDFTPESTTLAPSSEEDSTAAAMPDMQLPSGIPGEGDCLVEGKTYTNNSDVPATTPCDRSCKCISSIVSCKPVECRIPADSENCVLDSDHSDGCCPTYICESDSTTPKAVDTSDETKSTTIVPETSHDVEPTTTENIPKEVIIPSGITELPMSHVKPDEEVLPVTTQTPLSEEVTTQKDVKKPTDGEPTEEGGDKMVDATPAPEKEVQKPHEKEPTPEDDAVKETAVPTTEKTVSQPEYEPTTSASAADDTQKKTDDELATPTTAPTSSDDETKGEKPADEKLGATEDKIPATTIAPTSTETTNKYEEEPSSTEAHVEEIDKKQVEDSEKIPESSTTTPSESEDVTTIASPAEGSVSSDGKPYSPEDSFAPTTARPEAEEDQDKKKLSIPEAATEIPDVSEADEKKPTDEVAITESTIEKKPAQSSDIPDKVSTIDDDQSTSTPAVGKVQDETTVSPVAIDEESDLSTEKSTSEVEDVVSVTKSPEDDFAPLQTTVPSTVPEDDKKPSQGETATEKDEVELASVPSVTVSPAADKDEPSITASPSADKEDTLGQTTDRTLPEKSTEDKSEEEPYTTYAPAIDVSKKPEDEVLPSQADDKPDSKVPAISTSTPSDTKDQEDEESTTVSISVKDEEPQVPLEESTTTAPSVQDHTKKTSDKEEEESSTTSEIDEVTKTPSKEGEQSSAESTSTSVAPPEIAIDVTTIAPSTEEEPSTDKPIDIEGSKTPLESEMPEDKTPSTTPQSLIEEAPESSTKIPEDTDNDLEQFTTVSPALQGVPSEPFDEKIPSTSDEGDSTEESYAGTTVEPQATDDKKFPSLSTTQSSIAPEKDIKTPSTSDEEVDQEPPTDTDSTTVVPSSEEEDHIPTKVFPTAAPVDKSDSTTTTPAEEEIVKVPNQGETQPKPDDSEESTTVSQATDKPLDTYPSKVPAMDELEGDKDLDSTTVRPDDKKIISTSTSSDDDIQQPTTPAATSIKVEVTTSAADEESDVSTAAPAVAQDDDTEGTTVRPLSDKTGVAEEGAVEDTISTTPESEEDQEPARIPTTPTPIHIPGAEGDVTSQTVPPQSEDEKIVTESATTSAEDADKTAVTVAPVAADVEATSEVSKKPSDTEDVGEQSTEPSDIEHEGTTDQSTGAKLKPPTPTPTTTGDETSTKQPVEDENIVAATAQPDLEKETPSKSTEAPELETPTTPSDTEKSTKAPAVSPSLESTEDADESVESEEEHTTVSEDTHKGEEAAESAESEDTVTEPAIKKPEVDEEEIPAVVSELPQTTATPTAHDETSAEVSSEGTPTTQPDVASITTIHPLFAQRFSTTLSPVIADRVSEEETDATPTKQSTETSTSESPLTTTSPTTPQHESITPPSYGHQPQYPSYPEDEYDEEEVFGPGTCRYAGKIYVSAQQIPRDDPCDFCFCFRSDIICLQQSCPPPIAGCHEEQITGFCCPRYECPVTMAAVLNITTSTTTTSTELPPFMTSLSHGSEVTRTGCSINGRSYMVGEPIHSTSGPCMSCICGGDGQMKCDPQRCVPNPTTAQMMASATTGRKR